MKNTYGQAELILNSDGSVYHLHLLPNEIADTIIVVGDAGRVNRISIHFDTLEIEKQNRDFHSVTGLYRGKRITALSTGIGPDNIDIVINELDILANIDLKARKPKSDHKALNIIRLGTSGALQEDIPVDAFVMSTHGLGLDGLIHFYRDSNKVDIKEMSDAFIAHTHWPRKLARPYFVSAADHLIEKIGYGLIQGITATAPGFYGPQGRSLRINAFDNTAIDRISSFRYQGLRVVNFEMETSALFGLCQMFGHHALSVCVAVANRPRNVFSENYALAVDKLIKLLLDRLSE